MHRANRHRVPLRFAFALLCLSAAAPARAQEPTGGPPPAVFLDCQAHACDNEHIRNEVRFVNWMRDRTDADVHVLVTSQSTGGGGASYLVTMAGRGRFDGDSTGFRFATDQNSTETEDRDAVTGRIAQGLVRYALLTGAADHVSVLSTAEPDEQEGASTAPVRDPWNFWVFSAQANAELEGESREQEHRVELSFSANRVTADWKLRFEIEGTHDEQEFELTDRTVRSVQRDYEANASVSRAIARLWSAGVRTDVGTSSFENQNLYARVAALLEYSFFPYEDFSRRRVTLQYSTGVQHFDYREITIYDRLSEQRADHELELTVQYQQAWGSATVELSGAHYLDDVSRYNLSSFLNLNVRLVRGLSLDVSGRYERVRDQIYIPKGDASDEEVLLQRRALETGYRYGTYIGLRYTFGSIYNNIVNPRLDG